MSTAAVKGVLAELCRRERVNAMVDGSFGEKLRAHRKEAGLRLVDVAEALGFSVRFISQIERGNRLPLHIEDVRKVATLLGLTTRETNRLVARALGARIKSALRDEEYEEVLNLLGGDR